MTAIIIVMGVVGAGKTTIGSLLAQRLGWEFLEGDMFHPPANIEKMSHGIPLTDADRIPWLEAIRDAIRERIADLQSAVVASSALKQSYRDILKVGPEVTFVYLKAGPNLIAERLHSRHGHFATEQLLPSQFATLEEPDDAIVVDAAPQPEEIVREIQRRLRLPSPRA